MPANPETKALQLGQPIFIQGIWYKVRAKRKTEIVLRRVNSTELEHIKNIARRMAKLRSQHAPSSAEP